MGDLLEADILVEKDHHLLNVLLAATFAVAVAFLILASMFGVMMLNDDANALRSEVKSGDSIEIEFGEPIYMPRHEECIDLDNGQDEGYEGFGVGYEPSLAIDSKGNMQITAHKDLRWGGEGTPFGPISGVCPSGMK